MATRRERDIGGECVNGRWTLLRPNMRISQDNEMVLLAFDFDAGSKVTCILSPDECERFAATLQSHGRSARVWVRPAAAQTATTGATATVVRSAVPSGANARQVAPAPSPITPTPPGDIFD